MLPSKLNNLTEEIRSADPLTQSIPYYYETWLKQLYGHDELATIHSAFPRRISRKDKVGLYEKAVGSFDTVDIRTLFMAVMIWGMWYNRI